MDPEDTIIEFLENQLLKEPNSAVQVKQSDCYVPESEEKYLQRVFALLRQNGFLGGAASPPPYVKNWLQVLRKLVCIIHDESGKWVSMERDHPQNFQPELKRLYKTRSDRIQFDGNLDLMVDLVHRWFQKVFLKKLARGYSPASSPPPLRRFIWPGIYVTGIVGLLYVLNKQRTF